MNKGGTPPQRTVEPGFWRLQHDHLAALLARHDLAGEQLRVFLALADLTVGYGHERDVVSLSQIADQAGMYSEDHDGTRRRDYRHVRRALKVLEERGLYGQVPGKGQEVIRWVAWPPPPLSPPRTTARAGSSPTAGVGTGTTAAATAKTTAGDGGGTTARLGRHQEVQEDQDTKREGEPGMANTLSPRDSFGAEPTANGSSGNDGNDMERVLRYAFPSNRAPGKARNACIDRIAEAIRLGATYPLLAHAVGSPKAEGRTPWERIQEAGERVAALLGDARRVWPDFTGLSLSDLFAHIPPKWESATVERREDELDYEFRRRQESANALSGLALEVYRWRKQTTEWPEDKSVFGIPPQDGQRRGGAPDAETGGGKKAEGA